MKEIYIWTDLPISKYHQNISFQIDDLSWLLGISKWKWGLHSSTQVMYAFTRKMLKSSFIWHPVIFIINIFRQLTKFLRSALPTTLLIPSMKHFLLFWNGGNVKWKNCNSSYRIWSNKKLTLKKTFLPPFWIEFNHLKAIEPLRGESTFYH